MSFRLKTILGVAAIEAILLTILVVSGLHYITTSAEREFAQRAHATVTAFSVTSKEAVIASDLASLESFIQETLDYPGVVYARVRDARDRVLAAAGDPALLARPFRHDPDFAFVDDGVLDASAPIEEAGTLFGQVELGLTVEELQEVVSSAKGYGTALAVLEMVLVALFSLALGAYLTRQLERLSDASARVAAGDLGYQIPVTGRDELAQTSRAFNLMSARVRDSYSRLSEREEGLRSILQGIQDGILTLNERGRITSFSPAAEAIFRLPAPQAADMPLSERLSGETWGELAPLFETGAAGMLGVLLEGRGQRADGEDFPLELRITLIGAEPAPRYLVVLRDITSRRQAQEQLELRDRIIETTLNGVVITDATAPDLPVVYVNPAFEQITGYRMAEVIGKNCRFLQGPGTDGREIEKIRQALGREEAVNVVVRNYTKQGDVFWNDLHIAPIRDSRGRLTHYVALQNDITETMQAQHTLADREAFWRTIIDSTHDAIIVTDEEGSIESFNAGAEAMLGYSGNDVLGRNVSLLVPEPHKSSHDGYMRRYHETGRAGVIGQEREFDAERRDGSTLPIALRVTEMRTAERRLFIGVMHDITERKEAEARLKDSLREKETLLKEIHHRVKNNLLVVSSILEMQGEFIDEPRFSRVLVECQERIHSMALVHEKLYRSETLAAVEFSSYLQDLVDRLARSYAVDAENIRVHTEVEPIALNIETATPLGLVVNELVANCFTHAFPTGRGGDVWVSCTQGAGGGISLVVRDNWRGLPAEVDPGTTDSMGLQLVDVLARQLDGRLRIERGSGTHVALELEELKYKRRL
jgi:PAS domain S-box-containing protein